jgi:hypothetical protein
MLKTLVISFLVILQVVSVALLVWTIVDAHQRQRNNQPRNKYKFACLMTATIGVMVPIRFVLSAPAFIILLSLTMTTLFMLRRWMHAAPEQYRKEPLAYIPFGLIALLIAAAFAFIRMPDIGSSVIVAVFFVGIAGVGTLLKTDFLMGNTPQHYYRAGSSTIILGVAFACLSLWEPLALLPTGILLVIYGFFSYWYARFLANKTKHMLTERISR